MYLALFLAPWILMYALSTLAMANREFVQNFYPTKTPALTVERELDYSRTFTAGATPDQMGQQILEDLGLDGSHYVSGGKDGKPLVIEQPPLLVPLAKRAAPETVIRSGVSPSRSREGGSSRGRERDFEGKQSRRCIRRATAEFRR